MRKKAELPKELLQLLRTDPPESLHRSGFAEEVMKRIQHDPSVVRYYRQPVLYRWVSTSAAVFLSGWLLWQLLWVREPIEEYSNTEIHMAVFSEQYGDCVDSEDNEISIKQKAFCYLQAREKKNKSLEQQLVNLYGYEKK